MVVGVERGRTSPAVLVGHSLPLSLVRPNQPTVFQPKTVSEPVDCTGQPPCRTDEPSCTRNVGLVGGGKGAPLKSKLAWARTNRSPVPLLGLSRSQTGKLQSGNSPSSLVELAIQQAKRPAPTTSPSSMRCRAIIAACDQQSMRCRRGTYCERMFVHVDIPVKPRTGPSSLGRASIMYMRLAARNVNATQACSSISKLAQEQPFRKQRARHNMRVRQHGTSLSSSQPGHLS